MQTDEYARLFEAENNYWWYVARRHCAATLLSRHTAPDATVLDLGCGTGALMTELSAKGMKPVGIDMSPQALGFSKSRGLPGLVLARGEAIPIKSDAVPAVIALDVYEHIQDDCAALAETFRILQPGGSLVLSVPAFRWLWGPHDVALMHYRRYSKKEILGKLSTAGFSIESASYAIFFLFPAVVLSRLIDRALNRNAEVRLPKVPAWANRWLIALQRLETRLLLSFPLPWGSSVVVVAKKPG
ncbi:MAG: Ubiquinone biosynthesis O-methyltransferase [Fimbriimonadaceae bacterium]|nr:Ubiquinone biosynthesis O-methyltransferase [Fimbriimonadaceae bacterium]